MTKAILEKWMVAQKRHRLSDKQVQMARELGLNPHTLHVMGWGRYMRN